LDFATEAHRAMPASNDECLLKLLRRTSYQRGIAHVVIMCNFNFPDIDYEHGSVKAGPNAAASRFFDETQDLFLVQHVHAATCFWDRQEPSSVNIGLSSLMRRI